jgi:hypothetical protein
MNRLLARSLVALGSLAIVAKAEFTPWYPQPLKGSSG